MSEEGGGGGYVTRYGTASISRPNSIVVEGMEDWLTPEGGGSGGTAGGPDSVSANDVDPPPAEIPPDMLPTFARDAAIWNLAMALEYRRPIKRRVVMLVLYNFGTQHFSMTFFVILTN